MSDKPVEISVEVWKAMAESYYQLWQEAEKTAERLNIVFDGHYMDVDDD
jgi:hypothetical protein